MFELPSRNDVVKCAITKETIAKELKPTLLTTSAAEDEPEELAEESA
jgi:ATP-dependent protease Clp ATPase subunit